MRCRVVHDARGDHHTRYHDDASKNKFVLVSEKLGTERCAIATRRPAAESSPIVAAARGDVVANRVRCPLRPTRLTLKAGGHADGTGAR